MIRVLILLPLAAIGQADVPPPADRATVIAEALLAADQAGPEQSGRTLRRVALRTIDRLGGHPADGVDDPQPRWRIEAAAPAEPMRGRLLGPAFRHGAIPARGAWSVAQVFLAGQKATVSLAARPREATMLSITAPDTGIRCTNTTRCAWVPRFTERYTITVSNAAGAPARFFLVTD